MKINEIFSKLNNIYNMKQSEARDIQMLRLAIIAELDAANLYEQMAEYAYDADVATVLMDIANEEKQHIGEFEYLLEALDDDHEEYEDKGEEEIADLIGTKESTMKLVDKYLGEGGVDPAYYAKQIQSAKGDSNRLSNLKSTIKGMGEGRMLSPGDVKRLCDMIDKIRGK